MLRGVVHDPRSRALGGVAGHAGLFGTADDLAVFAQMLLDGGKGVDGKRVLSPLTVRAMVDPASTPEKPAPGARVGRRHVIQRPKGEPVRPVELRPHRVHRHEPLDRPGDRVVRDPPDQPPPPRRQGGRPDRPPGGGRHAGRLVDRGRDAEVPRARARDEADRLEVAGAPAGRLRGGRPGPPGVPRAEGQAGRPGDQPHGTDQGRRLDDRPPVLRAGRRAGRPLQPRARHPGGGGHHGRRLQGREDRPADLQPLRQGPQARPRGPGGRRGPGLRHPGHRGALLHLHQHARPAPGGGQGEPHPGRGPRPPQPDQRPGRERAGP